MAALPFAAREDDEVEVAVVDLGLARALWEGIPIGRLLARIRLQRDERDLVEEADRASGLELGASWDMILARLLAAAPMSLDRVKRAVARHARAASDEGPLAASDAAVAALMYALLASDADASGAEAVASLKPIDEFIAAACAKLDERIAQPIGLCAAAFEACLELARVAIGGPFPLASFDVTASTMTLYPWFDGDKEIAPADRRAVLLDRETKFAPDVAPTLTTVLAKRGAILLLLVREPRSQRGTMPSLPPNSWVPADADASTNAAGLAAAIERGSVTAPRARAILAGGGDAARDAIGKEMLEVSAHPFASAVFAEILAPLARERDVVRLVSYFAIAPDPSAAAHALDLCSARDVVGTVLRTWLETMLPQDGAVAEPGTDPDTSTSARVAECIAALRPYPSLYSMVRPLLRRLSEAPPGM